PVDQALPAIAAVLHTGAADGDEYGPAVGERFANLIGAEASGGVVVDADETAAFRLRRIGVECDKRNLARRFVQDVELRGGIVGADRDAIDAGVEQLAEVRVLCLDGWLGSNDDQLDVGAIGVFLCAANERLPEWIFGPGQQREPQMLGLGGARERK